MELVQGIAKKRDLTALYIRVSTDFQYEEGYSLDAQEEKLKGLCSLKNYKNIEVYKDGGWSGSNLNRPEMIRLISDIQSGKVKRVLVYKLDRLSRSQKDTLTLLEDIFLPNNIDFISMSENFDTSTPYGKAMIGILSVFAQLERENIRERTRMGMLERVKSGKWPGSSSAPFGYDYDANIDTLVPNQDAEYVKQIYDLYLEGYSTIKLANMFPVCSDKQIANILDRVTYTGKIPYKGEVYDGDHQPLIDEETYHAVQIERSRRSTKNLTTSNYLLAGFLVCGKCGAKMRYQKWGKDAVKIYCYSQQTSKTNLIKDSNCNNMRYDSVDVENAVLEDLFSFTDDYEYKDSSVSDSKKNRTDALTVLQNNRKKIEDKLKRLYNLYAESGNDILLETIEENKKQLDAVDKTIENEKESIAALEKVIDNKKAIKNIRNGWDKLTMLEKREVLSRVIDRIELNDNAINIHYLL